MPMTFLDTGILINPHSWYHICMGLDTVSGLLRIVVNGREVVNMEKEYFRNTTSWKSDTVDGKVLGKSKQQKKDRKEFILGFLGISYDLNKMDTFSSIQKLLGRILVPEQKHLLQHEHLQLDDVSGGYGHKDCGG